jgi:hypothetical protein
MNVFFLTLFGILFAASLATYSAQKKNDKRKRRFWKWASIATAIAEVICAVPLFQREPSLKIEVSLDTATATFFRDSLRTNNQPSFSGLLMNQPQVAVSADSVILDPLLKQVSIDLKISNRSSFPLSAFFIYASGALDSVTTSDSISVERMLDRHSKDGFTFPPNEVQWIPKKIMGFGDIIYGVTIPKLKTLSVLGYGGYIFTDPAGISHRGMFCYSLDIGTGSVKPYPRLNHHH